MARDWAVSSACALPAGANAAYSPPVAASARSSTTTAASGWRRRAESFFTDYPGVRIFCVDGEWARARLLDHVDRGEQADPDDVDEVPVVGHDDGGGGLFVGESRGRVCPAQDEQEGDEAACHMQTVEAGRQVEHRAVRVGGQGETRVLDQLGVLEDLASDEDRTHHERDDEPGAELLHIAPLRGENAELAGERGKHQDRGVRRRERE